MPEQDNGYCGRLLAYQSALITLTTVYEKREKLEIGQGWQPEMNRTQKYLETQKNNEGVIDRNLLRKGTMTVTSRNARERETMKENLLEQVTQVQEEMQRLRCPNKQ